MTFKKILCPTDFSPGSDSALRTAARIASDSGAELVILHSWHIPVSASSLELPFPAYVVKELEEDARRRLDAAVRYAAAAGAQEVSGKLLDGVPWVEITGELERQAYDLCVIGTHGRTGIARIMLGSVAEKVIRHSPCSVLVDRLDGAAKPFTHVVVPTDFSESADYALELATMLVQGSITLLHVLELPVAYFGDLPNPEFARDLDKRSTAALEQAAARVKATTSVPVTARSRIGYPGAQTLAAIEDDPTIDLVVMGSHGRTGIKRVLLGSVAEKVVRHARCPVLVARKRA